MENTTAVEPNAEKAATPGTGTKQPVKKTAQKTVNDQKGKIGTIKEEPVKEEASVNKKANKEKSNPEIMLIVGENPNEMIFPIVESEPELPGSKKKNKKLKKSDKKKSAKKHTLCKLVKNNFLKKHFSKYKDLVSDPVWICRKCGRVANDPKLLCKPILLSKIGNDEIIIS